jgi:hypothetical protein
LIQALIEKCISHAKATIKQKGTDCFLLLFEVSEVFDEPTFDTVLEMIKSKNAKISLTAIQTFITWFSAYGPKRV